MEIEETRGEEQDNMNTIEFKSGYDGSKIKIKFYPDSDIEEWKKVFKSVMLFATFSEDQLDFLLEDE